VKWLVPSVFILLLCTGPGYAIKITLFVDTPTFIERARDIVIAKCLAPVPEGNKYHDGLYPVDVEILSIIKGNKKEGKAKVATIYPMEAGKRYLLSSLGGSAFGTDFLAVPELSVVELPAGMDLNGLQRKTARARVLAAFTARRAEVERKLRELNEEKILLDKAVAK
jgi:hypothetical protein